MRRQYSPMQNFTPIFPPYQTGVKIIRQNPTGGKYMGAFPATDLWRNQHGMQSGLLVHTFFIRIPNFLLSVNIFSIFDFEPILSYSWVAQGVDPREDQGKIHIFNNIQLHHSNKAKTECNSKFEPYGVKVTLVLHSKITEIKRI